MLDSRIYLFLPLLCDLLLCDESTLPAKTSMTSCYAPMTDSEVPEKSNAAASMTTMLPEVATTVGRQELEPQDVLTTESSIPFVTVQTTPLVTLNGEELPMKVVPPTAMEFKYHSYLTESPPTTQALTTREGIRSTATKELVRSFDTTAQMAEIEVTAVEEPKVGGIMETTVGDPTSKHALPSIVMNSGFEVTSTGEGLPVTTESSIPSTIETTVNKKHGVSDITYSDKTSLARMVTGVVIASTEEMDVSMTAMSHGASPESSGDYLQKTEVATDLLTVTEDESVSAAIKSEDTSKSQSSDGIKAGATASPLSETAIPCSTASAVATGGGAELTTTASEGAKVISVQSLTPRSTESAFISMDTTEVETSLPPKITVTESPAMNSSTSAATNPITGLSSRDIMTAESSKADVKQTQATNPSDQLFPESVDPLVTSRKPDGATASSDETSTFSSTPSSSLAAVKLTITPIVTEVSSAQSLLEITTGTARSTEQDFLQSVLTVASTTSAPTQKTLSSQILEGAELTSNEVVFITTLSHIIDASGVKESASTETATDGMSLTEVSETNTVVREETLTSLTTLMGNEENQNKSTPEFLATSKMAQTVVSPSSEIESVRSTVESVEVSDRVSSSAETTKLTDSKEDVRIDSSPSPKVDVTATAIPPEIAPAGVPTGNSTDASGIKIATGFSTTLGSRLHESTTESIKSPESDITISLPTTEEKTPVTVDISETASNFPIQRTLVVHEVVTTHPQPFITEEETPSKRSETTTYNTEATSTLLKKDDIERSTHDATNSISDPSTAPVATEIEITAKASTVLIDGKIEDTATESPSPIEGASTISVIGTTTSQPPTDEVVVNTKIPETPADITEFTSTTPKGDETEKTKTDSAPSTTNAHTNPAIVTTRSQAIFTRTETAAKAPETPALTVQANLKPIKDDSEGMTLATAISMGLILIFMLILLCILAVSLIAGWVHCRGRESRHPKVSLIRVERGLATEFADSWSKGRSAQAWMTTQSGGSIPPPQLAAPSTQHQPLSASQSFKCSCKRRGLFGHLNRLCMIHGDPTVRHPSSPVRAVKIISLSDEDEADAVLLTQLGRRRASGASNTPNGEDDDGGTNGDSTGKRRSEWLFIDEA